ncbi:hypothetical protein Kpol_1045p24 [Vanderwaltozyma polyspora DSM 70294]|uniref:RING-type domain-containing protein n=1 Tax=Vanderwaltozyma polyspora (strain ATCC 22028 / DSM 70294 / BCRC 21397 / CBS 2163 / NBRC 10782 / NRRL Y-8283 / UCD 57-17) TaxID=436907 RepID=A7TI31_VANPO|nr:uncharacterized protein Kpol_1045p24 [Vanderwaltozyma polyspora DSM 70294]EDO18038.1 hypothetical protein Kpol_1045p24 [Vanderwaltozyma polyspora DSM 70294]
MGTSGEDDDEDYLNDEVRSESSEDSILVIDENRLNSDEEGLELLNVLDSAADDNNEGHIIPETIDLESEIREQQVVEVPEEVLLQDIDENEIDDSGETLEYRKKRRLSPPEIKPATDYRCPICFDPPETAMIAPCGHIYCNRCLFPMVNSSRVGKKQGVCALCRKGISFRDVRLVILKKKRVKRKK